MFLAPAVPNFPPPPIHPRPSYKVPYILPSSVRPKSFICHSYENCRGGGGSSKNLFKKNFRSLPSFPASGAAPCGDSGLFHESPVTSHQSLSPLECALPRFRALTPLECAVTKKSGGRGALPIFQFRFSSFGGVSRYSGSPLSSGWTSSRPL